MIAFLNWLDGVLWGVPLIALMILTGLYFTVRSGFFQFRHFGWIMKRTGGKLFQKEDKASEGKGMLSSFEAISTAIGGTVGFGNIAGVATTTVTPTKKVSTTAVRLTTWSADLARSATGASCG